jgi:hypothetical protein
MTSSTSCRVTDTFGWRGAGTSRSESLRNHAAFIWSVADLLRGDYKQSEYGRVILPMVVLRRLDCVLEPTKAGVLKRYAALKGTGIDNLAPVLEAVAGEQFYNVSKLDLPKLLDDPSQITTRPPARTMTSQGSASGRFTRTVGQLNSCRWRAS